MKKIRTLHIASFRGNIGDNANHYGARRLFLRNKLPKLDFEKMEIRDFYRGKKQFDKDFIKYANSFDLLFFGGGNYFELWPQNSKSGTSINLGIEDLEKIKIPIVFYSLGVDLGLGCNETNQNKFKAFLDYCLQKSEIYVSVRNDGAVFNLSKLFGNEYAKRINVIPDGGFFADYQYTAPMLKEKKQKIALNIAGDMLDVRTKDIGFEKFIDELSEFLVGFHGAYKDYETILFPHIFKDYTIINLLLEKLPDEIVRNKIQIAPYAQGDEAAKVIFGIYRSCDLVIGNRFHANVVPLGQGLPIIGLFNYPQIYHLYNGLSLNDRLVDCTKAGFAKELMKLTHESLTDLKKTKRRFQTISKELNRVGDEHIQTLKSWLRQMFK